MKRIREAEQALEARAKDEAAAAGNPTASAKPDRKARYNFTDPESRIMKGTDGSTADIAAPPYSSRRTTCRLPSTTVSARPLAEDRNDRRPDVPEAAHEDRRTHAAIAESADGHCGAQHEVM